MADDGDPISDNPSSGSMRRPSSHGESPSVLSDILDNLEFGWKRDTEQARVSAR